MGTRGLNVIVVGGEVRVAQYNQWDSYPAGQGATVLGFLRKKMKPDFKDKVLACSWITPEELADKWEECGAKRGSEFVGMDVSKKFSERFLHLHRDCGAEIYESSESTLHFNGGVKARQR